MSKKILGLDLGSNSIGWAVLSAQHTKPDEILGLGSRIFTKAVEDKTPTPKNQARRNARLARRVIQRRARRKQRMLNYLVKLYLLPAELKGNHQPEAILNKLGNPYILRAKALDEKLLPHELGRVFLHLVQRRGFLSNRKTLIGDLIDDPDVADVLEQAERDDEKENVASEETAFKHDIFELRKVIQEYGYRTLGEYLASLSHHKNKRNRAVNGGHLRTDRQMYQDELDLIWAKQATFHDILTTEVKQQIEEIIFKQRPIRLRSDRVGKCSLEPKKTRCSMARMEAQRFRYLQDINHLTYFDPYYDKDFSISEEDREKVIDIFEQNAVVTVTKLKTVLGLSRNNTFNLERGNKKLKGNTTACAIREVYPEWEDLSRERQTALVEDFVSIQKKSTLKRRLMKHWEIDAVTAISLCMIELEPGHVNLSLKAIRKLLPFLEQGDIYSDARKKSGYGYEIEESEACDRLPAPPETSNPIVNKGLHELRRVINAVIAEYGKPDAIRLEMARDLEMNTKRYKENERRQKLNTRANDQAVEHYRKMKTANPHLQLSNYPSRDDKIKYRIWKDQGEVCIYSGRSISLSTLFSPEIDVDHILPYSQSLDDSYMNKVVCYAGENRFKGQRTPIDAFSGDKDKWLQISQRVNKWEKQLQAKARRFFITAREVQDRDFAGSQLADTRYISRVALEYLKVLGIDISVTKGFLVSWLRYQWGLNGLLDDLGEKDRSDHRHHAIDAAVIACVDRNFHKSLSRIAKDVEEKRPEFRVRDLVIDPPWDNLYSDLKQVLDTVIVSHDPQRKIRGALHEDTGVGFKAKHGAVYRVNLNSNFKATQLKKILDPEVKEIVEQHLALFGGDTKTAFAEDQVVLHKDAITPIKRVRILQSKTTLDKLEKTKFGVRNKQGNVFKWMAYGNTHHVEILRHKKTGKIVAKFVTAMEASHRVKGIGRAKSPIIQYYHGEDLDYLLSFHINDIVQVEVDGGRQVYRVQKLEFTNNLMLLRLHTAALLNNKEEEIPFRFNSSSFEKWNIRKLNLNVLGVPHDQAHRRS